MMVVKAPRCLHQSDTGTPAPNAGLPRPRLLTLRGISHLLPCPCFPLGSSALYMADQIHEGY